MRELLKTWHYKAGYDVRYEKISGDDAGGSKSFVMRSAFTPDGHYVGTPRFARLLYVKKGIRPELARPGDNVCTVGFCESNQKWYGWSRRALMGFGIGNRLFEQQYYPGATVDLPFIAHGTVTIEALEQARQAAANFADYIS